MLDIQMSDDMDEFMELASGRGRGGGKLEAIPSPDEPSSMGDEGTPAENGKMVQYAKNGPGFTPTTATVQKLDPGVYEVEVWNDRMTFVPKSVVTDTLLRLPDSKSDEVIAEVERFWTLKSKFKKYGFTHKRGFLLWGPPGSGKTSTLAFIMNEMVKKGGIVILGDCRPDTLGGMLCELRQIEPERPVVVVLEDIDTIIGRYGESRVLSILDGESSIDNVVFLATTNYPEDLDGRVVNRPSRFDRVVKIGLPSFEARLTYIRSRLTELSDKEIQHWADITKDFSIAHIKELIVSVCCFGNKIEDATARLRKMKHHPKSSDGETVGFTRGVDD